MRRRRKAKSAWDKYMSGMAGMREADRVIYARGRKPSLIGRLLTRGGRRGDEQTRVNG